MDVRSEHPFIANSGEGSSRDPLAADMILIHKSLKKSTGDLEFLDLGRDRSTSLTGFEPKRVATSESINVELQVAEQKALAWHIDPEDMLKEKMRLLKDKDLDLKVEVTSQCSNTELDTLMGKLVKASRILHLNETELYFCEEVEDDGSFSPRNELESLNAVLSSLNHSISIAKPKCKIVLQLLQDKINDKIDKFGRKFPDSDTFKEIDIDGEQLLKWAESHNVKAKLKFFRGPKSGKGAMASEDIRTGDIVLEVPDDLIISEDTVRKSDMYEDLRKVKDISLDEMLMLWCMREKHNSKSKFSVYFQTLPREFRTGLSFGERALDDGSSYLCLKILDDRKRLSRRFQYLETVFEDSSTILAPACKFEDYLWARQLLYTNGFKVALSDGAPKLCLVPLAGIFNHSLCPHILHGSWTFDNSSLKFHASRPCKKEEQCFISYGDLPSFRVVKDYGIVLEESNPNDAVALDPEGLCPFVPIREYAHEVPERALTVWYTDILRSGFLKDKGNGLSKALSNLEINFSLERFDKKKILQLKIQSLRRVKHDLCDGFSYTGKDQPDGPDRDLTMQPTWDVELVKAYQNTISQVCSVALDDLDVVLVDLKRQLAEAS